MNLDVVITPHVLSRTRPARLKDPMVWPCPAAKV
jgi:hypothetical protein